MRLSHAEIAAERARARTVSSTPESNQLESNQLESNQLEVPPNGWAPIDLTPILFGERQKRPAPTMLSRADGINLLYDKKLHWISGEPEGLKSWLAQIAIAEAIEANLVAFYVDFEADAESVIDRLLALGAAPDAILANLSYHRPEIGVGRGIDTADQLIEAARARQPAITVIDGVQASMGQDDLDSNSAKDFYRWWGSFGRPLLKLTSGPTIAIDHVVKLTENRRQYAAGTGQKQAAVDVHIGTEILDPFGVGMTGRAVLTLQKDRPGMLQAQAGKRVEGRAPIGELIMKSDALSGDISYGIDPPKERHTFQPTYLMEQASACLKAIAPVAVSKNHIEKAVIGKAEYKRLAIERLVEGGFAGVDASGAHPKYQFIKEYVAPKDKDAAGSSPLRRASDVKS
jgi:hypothetical protein